MDKRKILFINYLTWQLLSPKSFRYELLSRWYRGKALFLSGGRESVTVGDFTCAAFPYNGNIILRQAGYLCFCVKEALTMRGPDYIVSYDPLFCGLAGVAVKFLCGGKLVVEVNSDHVRAMEIGDGPRWKRMVKKLAIRLVYRFADGLKFIDPDLRDHDIRYFGIRDKAVGTFFDFASLQVFGGENESGDYILFVGYPYHIKGVDVLIRAFNLISADFPHIKLKIIGHCEDRRPYEVLAAGNPNILFYPGREFDKLVPEFEGCRLFVLPSRTEAMGRVLLEAMACGKPVVASRVGGIPTVVRDGVNGLLFESEDHVALAKHMRTLLEDEHMAQRMGREGLRLAEEYSPRRYAELYDAFLRGI